jgi:ParB family chromosome partitioning protein
MTKKALGRGLDALINGGVKPATTGFAPARIETGADTATVTAPDTARSDNGSEPAAHAPRFFGSGMRQIPVGQIEPSRFQPRTEFDPEQLRQLADSIRQRGLVQPLLVRPLQDGNGNGRYELIAGERRWRAAREAGLQTLPAIVREASDREALEIALIENLQREDLTPIEEARAYEQLATQFALTQEQIAEKVGRSRAAVANAMRLLGLPAELQTWIAEQRLSVGHAKAILGLTDANQQRLVAERVLRRNLTVRETEQLVEHLKGDAQSRPRPFGAAVRSPHLQAIEERLRQKLGAHVAIHHGKKKGRIEIEYYGNDDLARLLGLLGVENL